MKKHDGDTLTFEGLEDPWFGRSLVDIKARKGRVNYNQDCNLLLLLITYYLF
jgi:hypothetical protein